MKLRLLPVIIFFFFALVVAKVFDLALEKSTNNTLGIKSNIQAVAEGEAKPAEEKSKDAKPEGKDAKQAEGEGAKKDEAGKKPDAKGEGKDAAKEEGGDVKQGPTQHNPPKNIEITDQVPMEKALLENLAKRRTELDDWANSIAMKESVLNAAEKKINSKMDELKKLEVEVSELLAQYKAKEDEKNKKLVKIYEGMKPADAAKIFDTMDMPILLEITGNMKEDNAAKILAKMTTTKAKDLTVKLAEQRRLTGAPPKL